MYGKASSFMYSNLILQLAGLLTILMLVGYLLYAFIKARRGSNPKPDQALSLRSYVIPAVIGLSGMTMLGIGAQNYPIHSALPLTMHAMTPDGNPPSLPLASGIARTPTTYLRR